MDSFACKSISKSALTEDHILRAEQRLVEGGKWCGNSSAQLDQLAVGLFLAGGFTSPKIF